MPDEPLTLGSLVFNVNFVLADVYRACVEFEPFIRLIAIAPSICRHT